MKIKFSFPSLQEIVTVMCIIVVFCILTASFIGLRSEHFLLLTFFATLFIINKETRKLAAALLPFLIFGISYDWMRVFPNYTVNSVDIEGLYNLEKSIFGIIDNGIKLIPCEYFAKYQNPVADFFSGIFYLGWTPIPFGFGLYLFLIRKREFLLRFALVFLFTNILGFICYYVHPAAPPWYTMEYGFEPLFNTSGNMAGLSRFDDLINFPLFASIYGRNSNVFAALPSLHSAYLLLALFYSVKGKSPVIISSVIAIFMIGIWATAVYTAHHYIIDVIAGIACALAGVFLYERGLMKLPFFNRFFNRYLDYIK